MSPYRAERDRAPVEPEPSRWTFRSPIDASGDLVAVGGDLAPGTLLAGYRAGLFPMRIRGGRLGWWSPDPRGVLPLEEFRVGRTLRRAMRRSECRVDTAFEAVMRGCADRPVDRWIDDDFVDAYSRLQRMGWAHSFETWSGERLIGGMYGVAIGSFFAGESMFHREKDAGKAALAGGVDWLRAHGFRLFDVQWQTPHLESLGVVEIPRAQYLELLADAVAAS